MHRSDGTTLCCATSLSSPTFYSFALTRTYLVFAVCFCVFVCDSRELYTKAGEVSNLRQRLAAFEKDLAEARAQYHTLLQGPAGKGSGGAGSAGSREAARVKELENQVSQVRTKLDFRENEHQKLSRLWAPPSVAPFSEFWHHMYAFLCLCIDFCDSPWETLRPDTRCVSVANSCGDAALLPMFMTWMLCTGELRNWKKQAQRRIASSRSIVTNK